MTAIAASREHAMTSALVPLSKDAASVVTALENAKAWLANAVETTGPAEIAAAKAQIVTAEMYARELRLSKDIQTDAKEMVRIAEFALGKAIRKGQEEGTVARRGQGSGGIPPGAHRERIDSTMLTRDLASKSELDGNGATLSRLGVDLRREVVRELTEAGLSTRAIAPVVGVSNITVSKDQGVRDLTPNPVSVTGVDGKTYAPAKPRVAPRRARRCRRCR
jgi:hypothetical protein